MMLMQIADTNVLILMPLVMVRKILMLIKLLIFIDVLMHFDRKFARRQKKL